MCVYSMCLIDAYFMHAYFIGRICLLYALYILLQYVAVLDLALPAAARPEELQRPLDIRLLLTIIIIIIIIMFISIISSSRSSISYRS